MYPTQALSFFLIVSSLIPFGVMGCSHDAPQPEAASQFTSQTVAYTTSKADPQILELGPQARKNLNLIVKPAQPTSFWRTITIPGVVADRPGISDRGVTSPAVGVISEIHVYPGDTVRPGQRLVTLRLFSEYLQATQTQLYRASQELTLIQDKIDRLSGVANAGAVSGSKMIELRNDLQRQQTLIRASKQELLNRGLSPEQIVSISQGEFISSITVVAPPPRTDDTVLQGLITPELPSVGTQDSTDIAYEVHALGAELGQTVQAGALLASLANHQSLYVIGHAFKREAGLLEQATQNGSSLRLEFAEDSAELWPDIEQQFQIRHLSNTIDTASRTFDFFVTLSNQSRAYQKDGKTYLVWRFRPGQRARIEVPVEEYENVFVLPFSAMVREGPNAYVYRQNGDLFKQIPVHVLHEDRSHVVVANDGSIVPGTYLAQNAAASLRRVLKAQSASGQQPGLHVHADGTVHAAH